MNTKWYYIIIKNIPNAHGFLERFCVKTGNWKKGFDSGCEINSEDMARQVISEFNLQNVKISKVIKTIYSKIYAE